MEQKVVELNVGGKLFKSTRSTLCSSDGYFARMLQHENWAEGTEDKPIFIDRDPTVFDGILSYLRSSQFLILDGADELYLKRLLVEADYYQLTALAEGIKLELAEQKRKSTLADRSNTFTQKVVGAPEVSNWLSLGWTYVAHFQGDETNACAVSGSKVAALWRSHQCTACGEAMSFEKFSKHVTFFRPTQVVLQKQAGAGIPNSDSMRDLDVANLLFDSSFG